MNWTAFWSGLLGTTLPGLGISLLVLHLTNRINTAMERHKKELQKDIIKFSKWHEKRLDAAISIYNGFFDYLAFLRRTLYVAGDRTSLDPYHEFRDTVERQIVFLDDATAEKVIRYQGELLVFWNWAENSLAINGESEREKIQHRLDYEIPLYLPRLREHINIVADPECSINRKKEISAVS